MARLGVYDNAVLFERTKQQISAQNRGGGKRSNITKFTLAARRRMRKFLASQEVIGALPYAVTLTLPWQCEDWSAVMDDFREVNHRFRTSWLRAYRDCGYVYRVELQRRGAPHLHLVAWHKSHDQLQDAYLRHWLAALDGLRGGSAIDFGRHGVLVDPLPNEIALIRYLCDHQSKRKQAQLGYKGKQWGVVGRRNFVVKKSQVFDLTEGEMIKVNRILRKLTRYRLTRTARYPKGLPCPFASKLVGGSSAYSVCYVMRETIDRIIRSLRG